MKTQLTQPDQTPTQGNIEMSEQKTVFFAGCDMDRDLANRLLNAVLPSVQRVTEELAIAGKNENVVKATAKVTAFAIVDAMASLLVAKAVHPTSATSPGRHSEEASQMSSLNQ